ncbi:MAG TPA: helicase C-terminal domain-containing protein, partial [Thermomicrobiales bacterium]|nr:helicase C-terminal domain-containing protein [Thermomicrobiales bacterium]
MSATLYIALDVEATEMHPERGEIIEIGALKFTDERIVDRWQATVRPRGPVPFGITALTGITEAEVRRARPFAAVAPELAAFVRQAPVVGQSVWLDLEMVRAAGLKLANPIYDTFELATLVLPGLPAYSLRHIAGRLGVDLAVEHRALADAAVTVEVFRRLLDQVRDFDAETLGQVARLLADAKSPLAPLFQTLAREKTRAGFEATGALGASLRQQLAARARAEGAPLDSLFLLPRQRPERLEPTGRAARIDTGRLRRLFAPGGAFARAFPGYEHRAQQLAMMEAVADVFNGGGRLIVEAGTGTGKGLAYLFPAIIHAVARGETVVVSTATINLQDQLYRKDLPDLQRVLGAIGDRVGEAPDDGGAGERAAPVPREFTAALLKGRGNYLCLRRWFTARQNARPAADEARLLAKTTLWLRTTDTGDRAELLLLPEEQAAWNHLAEHESACVAAHCIFQRRGQCFLYRARRQAESAHVVVVNHALLLSDLGTDGGVLPPYQHLIVDEAHHLEAEATRQFGFEVDAARVAQHLDGFGKGVNTGRAEGLIAELRARLNAARGRPAREALERADTLVETLPQAVTEARATSGVFFARVAAFVEEHGGEATGYDQRLRLTDALRDTDGWREVGTAWEGLHGPLLTIAEGLTTLLLALEPVGDELEGREDLVMELTLAQRANANLRLQAGATVGQPDPGMVYWVAAGGRERVSLNAAPLHVGAKLEQALFDTKRSVVLTSATLATEGSFAFVRERLGFTDARELRVPSPFDYESNVLLYLADDIPEPNSPGYQKRLNEALAGLCAATEGRALVLFTSYSALQATYRAVKAPLERAGVLVLGQRIDGNPRQLLDRFRDNPKAVLLGTSSFWEGVDVVGDALSVLVITKLPFAVPTDPVFAARSEQCADPFHDYAVPGAILRFKQGFGRLIR